MQSNQHHHRQNHWQKKDPLLALQKELIAANKLGHTAASLSAYFSPSWTAFQADRGRCFSVIVDDIFGGYGQVIF